MLEGAKVGNYQKMSNFRKPPLTLELKKYKRKQWYHLEFRNIAPMRPLYSEACSYCPQLLPYNSQRHYRKLVVVGWEGWLSPFV